MTTGGSVPGLVRVVGTGLLGTSIGLALRAAGRDVVVTDPSPSAQALAVDLGAGRAAAAGDPNPELVVVAAPPDVTGRVVAAELLAWPDAVVTDVASVKGVVLRDVTAHLAAAVDPSDVTGDALATARRFVGGHPLAGRERSGPTAARGDLFAGRPWVLTTDGCDPIARERVLELIGLVGAEPVEMAADDHDRAVALVSHLPQVAASLVAARLRDAGDAAVALAGQGVRDVTRIAASDPALWAQILGANAGPVAAALRSVQADLGAVVTALEALQAEADGGGPAAGARARLAAAVADGNAGHARLPGKHGAPPTAYTIVPVVVPDSPGELARLLTDVGEGEVNLEDLRLEHSPGQPVALAEISVVPGAADGLVRHLRGRGWTVAD